jgi:hypothetical protein
VVEMIVLRRLFVPLAAVFLAALALLAPGAIGAQPAPPGAFASSSTSPTGPTGVTGTPGATLSATLTACHADPLQANRYAIFASQMNSIPGTRTMAVDFVLQQRNSSGVTFAHVSAPGFGAWVSSQPRVGIYTYDHEVTALPAPGAFRVLVRARWLDRHRRVIRRAQLVSPICVQPLQAPDIALGALRRVATATPGTVSYSLTVVNGGTVAAGPFQVSLTVNGAPLTSVTVPGLAAGASTVAPFSGPRCTAGSTLSAVADPAGAVTEPANAARSKTFPCVR